MTLKGTAVSCPWQAGGSKFRGGVSAAVANLKGSKIHARRKIAKSEKRRSKSKWLCEHKSKDQECTRIFRKHMLGKNACTKQVSKRESNVASMAQHQDNRRQECKPNFRWERGRYENLHCGENDHFLFRLLFCFFHLLLSDHHSAHWILGVRRVLGFQKKVVMVVRWLGSSIKYLRDFWFFDPLLSLRMRDGDQSAHPLRT